jgi:AcrR family transcriptional regulator
VGDPLSRDTCVGIEEVVSTPDQCQPHQDQCQPHLRADARRNRLQILEAAETCFAEQGIGVPIDDIARLACVGVGTVYRHFPTKEALVEAVIFTRMEKLAAEARAVSTSDDPGEAFFAFLARMAEEGSAKRDLVDALTGAGVDFKQRSASVKDELEDAMGLLLKRAQASGDVRTDIEMDDLFALVLGTCMSAAHMDSPSSQTRMLNVVCDGLRTERTPTAN